MRQISLRFIFVFSLLLLSLASAAAQDSSSSEAARLLPKTVGDFRLQGNITPPSKEPDADDGGVLDAAQGVYVSPKGERLTVRVFNSRSHAFAYSYLTRAVARMKVETQSEPVILDGLGVAAVFPGTSAHG